MFTVAAQNIHTLRELFHNLSIVMEISMMDFVQKSDGLASMPSGKT